MDEQRKRLIELIGNANTKLRQEFPYVVGQERIEKIADYLFANGVIVLPCEIGSKIWFLCQEVRGIDTNDVIYERTIDGIWGNRLNPIVMVSKIPYELRFHPTEFGKTVFPTREEAEAALAERQTKEKE